MLIQSKRKGSPAKVGDKCNFSKLIFTGGVLLLNYDLDRKLEGVRSKAEILISTCFNSIRGYFL